MRIVYTDENKRLRDLAEKIDSNEFHHFLMENIHHLKKMEYGIDRLQVSLVKKYINEFFLEDGMLVTNKVEHAHGIGNNNRYYVQDMATGELFGCINLNTDMFGGMYFSAEDINEKPVSNSYAFNDWGIKTNRIRNIDWDSYSFTESTTKEVAGINDDIFLKRVQDINKVLELIEEAIASHVLKEGPENTIYVCKRYGEKECWELVNKLEAAIDLLNQNEVDTLRNAIEEKKSSLDKKIKQAADLKDTTANEKDPNEKNPVHLQR